MPWYMFLYFWSLWHQPVYYPPQIPIVQYQHEQWIPAQPVIQQPADRPTQYVVFPPCFVISPTVSVCP